MSKIEPENFYRYIDQLKVFIEDLGDLAGNVLLKIDNTVFSGFMVTIVLEDGSNVCSVFFEAVNLKITVHYGINIVEEVSVEQLNAALAERVWRAYNG